MLKEDDVKSVIIIGGGTAGWMSAAAMASILIPTGLKVTLIESEAIGTVGVGEATLPGIRYFNQKIGLDEAEVMRRSAATFKLGIEFNDWGKIGDSYIHPFGSFGPVHRLNSSSIPFHHYLSRAAGEGHDIHLDNYSLPVMASRSGKFQRPSENPKDVLSTFGYAYQFDASLYAQMLREFCEARGVTRIEGRVTDVSLRAKDGFIEHVTLENGDSLGADLFIDCSGFYGLLISKTLKQPYKDWTHYLPCNRAVTTRCDHVGQLKPFTTATAKSSGWQWRIPLQSRTGNGYVYSSDFISDDEATSELLSTLEAPAHSDPKTLRFTTGQRTKTWYKNCVAIGLSGGFLEPLESTGIFLIQEAITHLVDRFPSKHCEQVEQDAYNHYMDLNFERVRDFLLLHYVATERDDSPFWIHMSTMQLPDSLVEKMDLWRSSGRIISYETGAFKDPSWLAVYYGQNIFPKRYSPMAKSMPETTLKQVLSGVKHEIDMAVDTMTDHKTYIDEFCRIV